MSVVVNAVLAFMKAPPPLPALTFPSRLRLFKTEAFCAYSPPPWQSAPVHWLIRKMALVGAARLPAHTPPPSFKLVLLMNALEVTVRPLLAYTPPPAPVG